MWLGETVRQFHADLARFQSQHAGLRYHYVTGWEMAQLVRRAASETAGASFDEVPAAIAR
jgi:hypothetical protein